MARKKPEYSFISPKPESVEKSCAINGCKSEGLYRAPKDRDNLEHYIYLCLDHIKAYNAGWDYYKGMSTDEIIKDQEIDMTWRRPRRPFSEGAGVFRMHYTNHTTSSTYIPGHVREALRLMDLEWPLSMECLKRKYKELVKRYHPDLNGGCSKAEEKFKNISVAYKCIKSHMEESAHV